MTIGININLTDSFQIPSINFKYLLEPEVKTALDSTIENLKKLKFNVVDFSYNIETWIRILILTTQMAYDSNCYSSCGRPNYDSYFNDTSRFDFDSPYHSFDELMRNPKLLSPTSFDYLNANDPNATDETCAQNCANQDRNKEELVKLFLDSPGVPYYDAMLVPTVTYLPFIHYNFNISAVGNLPNLCFFVGIPQFAALAFPGAYSPSTSDSPDGLPIGMMLIIRPNKVISTLKIATLLEKSKNLVKLPQNTPIIRNLDKQDCQSNNSLVLKKNVDSIFYIFVLFLFTVYIIF